MLSPLLLFPEGEPTTGDAVAHFDEELFCAKYQIQPISIQYHLYLTPPGFNSVYGNKNSIWKTLFRIVSIPFIVVDLNYLSSQQIKYEQTGKKQKAENAQLQIANNIGVIAISNL